MRLGLVWYSPGLWHCHERLPLRCWLVVCRRRRLSALMLVHAVESRLEPALRGTGTLAHVPEVGFQDCQGLADDNDVLHHLLQLVLPSLHLRSKLLRNLIHVISQPLRPIIYRGLKNLCVLVQPQEVVAHSLGSLLHVLHRLFQFGLGLVSCISQLGKGRLISHSLLVQRLDLELQVLVGSGVIPHRRCDFHEHRAERLADLIGLSLHLLLDGSPVTLEV
mmetsp:Transcript_100467/g.181306  ORF Transcript_100467/g.181306 Transcript_100467/m.181306 type:complete len:220 (+) Transcript_100467:113-772(+)